MITTHPWLHQTTEVASSIASEGAGRVDYVSRLSYDRESSSYREGSHISEDSSLGIANNISWIEGSVSISF